MTNSAGSISLAGTVNLSLLVVNGYLPALGDKFFILTRADAAAFINLFAGAPEGGYLSLGIPGYSYHGVISYLGDSMTNSSTGGNDVVVTVVPEPVEYAAGVMGMLVLAILLREKRRKRIA